MHFNEAPQAGKPWTTEDMIALYEHRLQGTPYEDIGIILGRTNQACRDKHRNTNWSETGIPDKIQEKIKKRKLQTLEEHSELLYKKKKEMHRQRTDLIADKLSQHIEHLPPAPLTQWSPPSKDRDTSKSYEHMGVILSDLHVGHDHSFAETGGLSEYNLDVFKQRMKNMKYAVAEIYELHSHMYKIPELHVFCLGDIVEGMNAAGAWSSTYIQLPIMEQIAEGFKALSDTLWYWLTIFEKVHFYGIRGNHGRVALSGIEKDYCNWDIIIYDTLNIEFRNNPRIDFTIPRSWFHVADIEGHNFLLCHGDDVKSKNTPIQGLMDVKGKMQSTLNCKLDYALCGHFHSAGELTSHSGKVLMNGSFVGSDVYSLKNNMPGNKAEQKLFGINKNRGITYKYDINLDHKRTSRETVFNVNEED